MRPPNSVTSSIGIASLTCLTLASANANASASASASASFSFDSNSAISDTCPPKDTSTLLLPPPSHISCPPITSNTSPPHLFSPFTHPPICTDQRTPETYCIFTSTHIGHHGLSLVTTPFLAATLSPLLHTLYDSPFPSHPTVRKPNLFPLPCEIGRIPGKGYGVVATRRISAGETFLVDYASLVLHAGYPRATTDKERVALLKEAVDRLVEPGPRAVRALARSGLSKDRLEDVVQTNVFTRQYGDGDEDAQHHVLYPIISRINHSCKPNSFLRYSSHGLTVGIAAFHDIQQGEEITISYINPLDTHKGRQNRLKSNWGFTCKCALCTSSPTRISASDAARAKIHYLRTAATKAITSHDLDLGISHLRELVETIKKEDMPSLLEDPYEALMTVHWVLGEEDDAMRYLHLRLDVMDEYGRLEVRDREAEVRETVERLGPLGARRRA